MAVRFTSRLEDVSRRPAVSSNHRLLKQKTFLDLNFDPCPTLPGGDPRRGQASMVVAMVVVVVVAVNT